jgi:hypothetical protein
MCTNCGLTIPSGVQGICHACAMALRAEIRRGLRAIEAHLGGWSAFECWLAEQE